MNNNLCLIIAKMWLSLSLVLCNRICLCLLNRSLKCHISGEVDLSSSKKVLKIIFSASFSQSVYDYYLNMAETTYLACLEALRPSMTVEQRHLPFYSRFESRLEFSAGRVTRVYNPSSLSRLSSVMLVANCSPVRVQR